ncbi:MAG: cobalamin-binding protein [Candidatus Acidiferrales bacterium]|jgi:iron complex transport system substrate-binding protein
MKRLLFILLICGGALSAQTLAAKASPSANVPMTHEVTDEIGRHVQIPSDVKRIVSLAPNLTEIIFAMGKHDDLAGDTDFCDYPAEASQKPHVGGPINPNLEQIVALKPDLILATKSINRRETVDALDRLGLPVYVTDPHSVDEMILSVEHLGKVLGADTSATTLVEDLRTRLDHLDRRLARIAPRRALFIVWTDPLISVGRDTFIADAFRRAGARSVVDTPAEWPRISFEEIIRLQPEFLVFASAHAADTQHDIDSLRSRPGWRDLDALRRGNVVIVSDAINRPAPRMLDAVEQLARAFHPEAFSSLAHLSYEQRTLISGSGAWAFTKSSVSGSEARARFTVNVHRERHAAPLQLLDDFGFARPSPIAEEDCGCAR